MHTFTWCPFGSDQFEPDCASGCLPAHPPFVVLGCCSHCVSLAMLGSGAQEYGMPLLAEGAGKLFADVGSFRGCAYNGPEL